MALGEDREDLSDTVVPLNGALFGAQGIVGRFAPALPQKISQPDVPESEIGEDLPNWDKMPLHTKWHFVLKPFAFRTTG
jgi:hypothetical protein